LETSDKGFEEAYIATERAYLAVDLYDNAPEKEKKKFKKLAEKEIEKYENTKMPDISDKNNQMRRYLQFI